MGMIATILAMLVAFSANAAKEKDRQFTHKAEFRLRYLFEDNQSGSNNLAPDNGNTVEQRLKLGGNYKVSEKFNVSATLLHNSTWGSPDLYVYDKDGNPGTYSAGDARAVHNGNHLNNFLLVNEVYGSWLVGEDMLFKFGRMTYNMGDGTVIAANDYEPTPYAFDGINGVYEFDFGRLTGWVVKMARYSRTLDSNVDTTKGIAQYSGNEQSSPEYDAYGLSFDVKKMPEWLKLLNAHVIKDSKPSTPNAASLTGLAADPIARMGQDTIRYGLALAGEFSRFDFKADLAGANGKYLCSGTPGGTSNCGGAATGSATITKLDHNSLMWQLEAGLNYQEFMKARLYARYHSDSGDSDPLSSATKIGTYDPYFYDQINGSGLMQVVGWGNLTFVNAGFSVSPTDQTNVILQYWYFMKTQQNGQLNPGRYGTAMVGITSTDSDKLGQEWDLAIEHKYDGGFTILTRFGYFLPGNTIKNAISGVARNDNYFQAMVQGKIDF